MFPYDYLARLGFDSLLAEAGGPTPRQYTNDEEDDNNELARVERETAALDHGRVLELLLRPAKLLHPDTHGIRWGTRRITWPDRVPGLRTWAGQVNLAKIVAKHQKAPKQSPDPIADLFAWGYFGEGASGIDPGAAPNALDHGYSLSRAEESVWQRGLVELLAIAGLETVPLVSFDARVCGFVHADRVWRFELIGRDGGYFYKWGTLT